MLSPLQERLARIVAGLPEAEGSASSACSTTQGNAYRHLGAMGTERCQRVIGQVPAMLLPGSR